MLPIWVDDVSHHSPSYEVLSRSRDIARRGEGGYLNRPGLVDLDSRQLHAV